MAPQTKSWFRHILTLRPFIDVEWDWWYVGLGVELWVDGDPGFHFTDLGVALQVLWLDLAFGIRDTN